MMNFIGHVIEIIELIDWGLVFILGVILTAVIFQVCDVSACPEAKD